MCTAKVRCFAVEEVLLREVEVEECLGVEWLNGGWRYGLLVVFGLFSVRQDAECQFVVPGFFDDQFLWPEICMLI